MKKNLLAVMLLVGIVGASFGAVNVPQAHASGTPFDWVWTLNDSSGNPYTYSAGANFTPDETHVLVYDPGTHIPRLAALNGGIQIDPITGYLVVDNIPQSEVTNLVANLATLTTGLAGKAASSHMHSTSDIVGLASFVDSRIASTTQPDWGEASTTLPAFIRNKPTIPTVSPMVFATTTRSLNTAFLVSSTSAAFVSYTVDIATTLSLTTGQTGTVTLQYADDSGFTTNVKTVQSSVNGNGGTLAIGLGLTQTGTAALTGMVPAGKYVKIVTANTVGTPTFTYRSQQEVLLPSN